MVSVRRLGEGAVLLGVVFLSVWAAASGYQLLSNESSSVGASYYYTATPATPVILPIEVDRMNHAAPLTTAATDVVDACLHPLGIEVEWTYDEILADSIPLNQWDAQNLLARTRGGARWLGRDQDRYSHAIHLVLGTIGGGDFRNATGKRYVQGLAYRHQLFQVNGGNQHSSEGIIVFTHNIRDALWHRYHDHEPSRWQKAIGHAIAHEIGHMIGYSHAMEGFMGPELDL